MITSKYIAGITAFVMLVSLAFCGLIVYGADTFDTIKVTEYQRKIFSDEIITVDIQADPNDWQKLLGNATAKEWIQADVIINGERFESVGVRTKGNSSLTQGGRNRYSMQFKFNKFVKGQTYYGLDTFCVNNMMGDATYMKDYISYDIMNFIGVETPLVNYANVSVNGENYMFGLALERYDQAFLDRVYDTSEGHLYSVKISMGRRGDFEDTWEDITEGFPNRQDESRPQDGSRPQGRNFGMGRGGVGMGGFGGNGGGSLVYTDDEISSYSAIFDNAIFNKTTESDNQRVITAIRNLNEGTDLEKYLDVDQILRYFAAHTVVVNLDSYVSNMQQNYYIYERDGKLTILPWDYNLAFGGFQSGNASSVVNFPIDTPVSGTNMESRPLLNKLLEIDEYREKYHNYLREIVENYFESGLYEKTINEINDKISEYVKNDVSPFYTYEQYQNSLPVLIELGRLRALSIRGQLDGEIPSTSSGQSSDNSALIDASGLDISALGTMGMGGMRGDRGDFREFDGQAPIFSERIPDGEFIPPGEIPDRGGRQPGRGDRQPPDGNFGNREPQFDLPPTL